MSDLEKKVAAEIAEMLPKIAKKVAEGHAAGYRKIADRIHCAADQSDEVEKRLASDAANPGKKVGQWRSVNEKMSRRARDYQEKKLQVIVEKLTGFLGPVDVLFVSTATRTARSSMQRGQGTRRYFEIAVLASRILGRAWSKAC